MNIYYVLEILLGPTWESESGGILCEIMQRFDEKAQRARFTVFAMEIISAVLKTWETRKIKA